MNNMLAKLGARFSGLQGRKVRDVITAYLMVTPALVLIFTFGIFPVLFAVYVSLHKWKIKQGDFIGLVNYVKAIDALAYLLFFALAIGFIYIAYQAVQKLRELVVDGWTRDHWLLGVNSVFHAGAAFLLLRWAVFMMPEFLGIADLVRTIPDKERTFTTYFGLFADVFTQDKILQAFWVWLVVFGLAWVITAALSRWVKLPKKMDVLAQMVNVVLFSVGAVIVAWFTYAQAQLAVVTAQAAGEEVQLWVQIITIGSGVILWVIAWRLWTSAVKSESSRGLIFKGLAAALFLVGGWLLIGELPAVIQAGNDDLWTGLKVTAYYSLGTIPFQLGISLVLAFFLFQNLRGKQFFRMLFFLPYITPAVASAAVYTLIFSPRPTALMNKMIAVLGFEPQKWLYESRGIFRLIATNMGFENYPMWAEGPSQALVVIIIYSIWVYVGYDVIIYMAGLGNIPNDVYEAAAIDGASRWEVLRHITLPLLTPTIYFLSLIAVIGTFKAFNHIFIMRTNLALNSVDTMSVAIFDEFFIKTRFGSASAMAFVLFAVILALTYINNKVQGSRVFYG